jgi:nicotinate-nucleotide pyrophosphorylase (carboxylating)
MNLKEFIHNALEEDIGEGDHTSLACIPDNAMGKAHLLVKQDGVLAGVELAQQIFRQFDPELKFHLILEDGEKVTNGDIAFTIEGRSRSILTTERLVLNCMQRMSGIATLTNEMVSLLEGLNTKILDTRKTTPGFRMLEKWAVRIGGGENHRVGLYDMIMIKDNHIDFTGGINEAINAAHDYLNTRDKNLKICIEARSLDDIEQIMNNGKVDRIMLDNFKPSLMKDAISLINHQFETEATGGITKDTLRTYAESGVDYISVGAITHSAGSLDLSLKAID